MDYQKLPDSQKRKLADDAKLLQAWKKFHREQLTLALAGPHGQLMRDLLERLDLFELFNADSTATLLAFLRHADWDAAGYEVRLVAVYELNATITKLRERHGLPPFDDGRNDIFCRARRLILPEN